MMNYNDLDRFVQDHVALIASDAKSLLEARDRATKFLVAQSVLASFLKGFDEDKAKISTLVSVSYSECIRSAEGKNITEKKCFVDADPRYTFNREAFESVEAIRDYIKTHIRIFENAHLTFRQYSRE